jgi:polyisoprenoid-binding protein YceI
VKLRKLGSILALALLGANMGWSAVYDIDTVHSQVGFKIRHFVAKTGGQFDKYTGSITFDEKKPANFQADATIEATSINTANDKRDEHLRSADFFNVEKFPTIKFKSTKAEPQSDGTIKVTGDFTMLGVTKPIVLSVEVGGVTKDPWGGTRAGFSAKGKINRKEFGMNYNKVLDTGGVMLGEDVELSIEVEGVAKK